MKIFIAGATGVLGRRLVKQFRERGHVVRCLARNQKNEATIHALGGREPQRRLFHADSLARAAEGCGRDDPRGHLDSHRRQAQRRAIGK